MKKYFYSDGTKTLGPFSIDDLKEEEIARETMIWFQELDEWKKADEIQELGDLFSLTPPPIRQKGDYNQQLITKTNSTSVTDTLVFLSIVYWCTTSLVIIVGEKVIDHWYENDLFTYFRIGTNIVWSVLPIIIALSIKNKTLKIIALVMGALLSIYFFYTNIGWLIRELK